MGTYEDIGNALYHLQSKTGTALPNASQTIKADDDYYGLSSVFAKMPSSYEDIDNCNGAPADVLSGFKVHTNIDGVGTQIIGTMPNNGVCDATIDGITTKSYVLPSGYYGGGSVSLTDYIETLLASI